MSLLQKSLITLSCLLLGVAGAAESLEAMVNRANEAANRDDYATAIPLYEQAIRKAPAEKVLKTNLAALYANQGVNLQEQKKFDEAIGLFDKGLALVDAGSREAGNIRRAKAGAYFSQAMAIRDNTENPAPDDFAKMKTLLEQAMALDANEPAFKKGLAGVYLDEAYRLAVEEKYSEAMPLLEKATGHDPQNKAVKQSLANVYLGMAKTDAANQKSWIDKALAIDNSPRMQQVAEHLQNPGSEGKPGKGDGFATAPNEARAGAPAGITDLSVADMIRDAENQMKIEPPKNATLLERLEALEKQVLGKKQTGALAVRTKAVYTALMGSYDGSLSNSNTNLVQAPAKASPDSYLDEIFKVTDGKVIRWGKFPLRVYIEEPKDNPLFKKEYREAAFHGLNAWKVETNGFVNYVEVKNPDSADVTISFTDQYVDRYADPEKAPDFYKNYTPPKRNPLMQALQVASMLAPGYYSLAPQALAAGLQYKQYKQVEAIREESRIKLGLTPTKDLQPEAARLLIQNMAAKEFGHALGLKGSSSKQGDLLYPELRSDVAQLPSRRDLATLKELYDRPPNIILNVR